jgi:hypothetical protein
MRCSHEVAFLECSCRSDLSGFSPFFACDFFNGIGQKRRFANVASLPLSPHKRRESRYSRTAAWGQQRTHAAERWKVQPAADIAQAHT